MEPRSHHAQKVLILFGLMAPALTFIVAISEMSMGLKTIWLLAISAIYAAICGWAFFRSREAEKGFDLEQAARDEPNPMAALEEASLFFGSSFKPADTFKLVSTRVRDIVPNIAAMLLVPDDVRKALSVKHSDGEAETSIFEPAEDIGLGIAGMAFLSGEIELDPDLSIERASMHLAGLDRARASAAIPLIHDGQVFGVIQLVFDSRLDDPDALRETLGTIGEKISPLFVGAQAVERSLSGALTDPLTELPNERAFLMVLESQVAESLRFGSERPLTVLVADIKGFEAANRAFGHAAGDRVLRFAGETILQSLRKMDFLSRSEGDEFAVVLPRAGEVTANDVIERIKANFASSSFPISEHESIKLWLHFGAASFPEDGETAEELMQTARSNKQRSKAEEPAAIYFADREYLN